MKKFLAIFKDMELMVAVGVLVVFVVGLVFAGQTDIKPGPGEFATRVIIEEAGECNLVLDNGDSAADALDKCTQKRDIPLRYEEFSFGRMVVKIGDKEGDNANFWALYYNGTMSFEGADDLKLKEGDTTEWKYEEIKL